jgi:hypothetical protein
LLVPRLNTCFICHRCMRSAAHARET